MTKIHCYTCDAYLEDPGYITPSELAARNNWLPVSINSIKGYLCEQCSKWIESPIHIRRDRLPEEFIIERL